jgi:Zn-dependent peptidase ImmA (M78 family)
MWIAQQAAMEATSQLERAKVPWDQEIDVFSIIEQSGLPLIFRPLKHLSGAYIPASESTNSRAGILINSNHPRTLQRYTASHEYGHHVRDQALSLDREFETEIEVLERKQHLVLPERERFAEVFASWFLMPPQLVINLHKRLGIDITRSTPEDIYQLALALGTSYRATITQLVSLRMISWSQANRLRNWQPKEIKQKISWSGPISASRNDIWVITKKYNGFSIHPRVGDELLVCLPEAPSTGYIWVYKYLESTMTLTDQRFVEAETKLLDTGGLREFRFKVEQVNTLNLVLSMQRPWLREKSEADSFTMLLIIEEDRLGINSEMLLVGT